MRDVARNGLTAGFRKEASLSNPECDWECGSFPTFYILKRLPVLRRQTYHQVPTSCHRAAVDAPRTSSPDCGLDGLVWGYWDFVPLARLHDMHSVANQNYKDLFGVI